MWVDGAMNLQRRTGTTMGRKAGLWAGLWGWVKDQLVGEVPHGDALCEFDCPHDQCRIGEWATCKRRLAQAEGELWPGDEAGGDQLKVRRRDLRN